MSKFTINNMRPKTVNLKLIICYNFKVNYCIFVTVFDKFSKSTKRLYKNKIKNS